MNGVPSHRTRTISRHRLLQSLRTWRELHLVYVIAPAGYGKSTLTAAWARSLAELPDNQRPAVAWISLFENLDAERCLHALTEALLPTLPALRSILSVDGSGEYSLAQRTRMLCSELNAAPRPIVLIVDDYHLLTDSAPHAVIQQILDSTEHNFLLVLVSRTTPPLRIDRLVLDDSALTLSKRDLTFDHDEFLAFMQLVGMDSQPPNVLEDIEKRCTGWVTALKLVTHDLQHSSSTTFSSFANVSHNLLHQFIESRILATMPPDLREFVACTTFLPWMSAPLMAATTGASPESCAHMLSRLMESNAFLAEFASPSGELRFRFHPLVQEVLQHITTDRITERHRAADWFLTHDQVDEALVILDGQLQLAADALAHAVRRALLRFDITSAQRWLAALPATLLETHAALAINAAWAAYFANALQPFETAIPRAVEALLHQPAGPLKDELHVECAGLGVYQHVLHSRSIEAQLALADAEALPRSQNSLGNGYLHFMRALLPLDASDLDARTSSLQAAANIFDHVGHHYGVIETLYTLFLLKRRYINLPGALASSIFLESFAERHNRSSHSLARENLLSRGELLYMQNRVAEAREILQRIASSPTYDEHAVGNAFVAHAYLALCDAANAEHPAAALHNLDEAADAAHWAQVLEHDFNAVHGMVAWPRILRDSRAGHPERCRQTAESLRLAPADLSDQTHDTLRFAVLAGAVLGEHDSPQLAEQLDAILAHLHAAHFYYMALHVRVLRVLHARLRGDELTALDRLHELLPDVERSGMLRLLLDFPALQPLLRQCDGAFARQMLALYPSTTPTSPTFTLTDQEKRILAQLTDGLSTKQIAAALTVTHKTVYTHVHSIFKKLGVHNRKEAMRVWRDGEEQIGDSDSR